MIHDQTNSEADKNGPRRKCFIRVPFKVWNTVGFNN